MAEVPAVVAEAASAVSEREAEFWQRLLAAEAQPAKTRQLLPLLRKGDTAVAALLESPLLSPPERQRASQVSVSEIVRLFESGVCVVGERDLPECYGRVRSVPPALFCWGDPSVLSAPRVAIVGTRGATSYGKAVAQKFAEALAKTGITIVSGGALGIDAAAHKGALAASGKTAAVMLTGIDRVYPRVHHGLFEQIKRNGCLLSQFAAGIATNREFRPLLRNQTVAALSDAVIVVEAPERSGALSTASAANDFGRQVFVVPANIDNLNFRGSHALIRDGATLVDHPDQVLDALGMPRLPLTYEKKPEVSPVQQQILDQLSSEPLAAEFVAERSGVQMHVLMSEMTDLEILGLVSREPGGYIKCP